MISLALIFGILCRSSSWWLGPHIGVCRLLWPLLRAWMGDFGRAFRETYFDMFYEKIKFWRVFLAILGQKWLFARESHNRKLMFFVHCHSGDYSVMGRCWFVILIFIVRPDCRHKGLPGFPGGCSASHQSSSDGKIRESHKQVQVDTVVQVFEPEKVRT